MRKRFFLVLGKENHPDKFIEIVGLSESETVADGWANKMNSMDSNKSWTGHQLMSYSVQEVYILSEEV
jgi:hypothetical protein